MRTCRSLLASLAVVGLTAPGVMVAEAQAQDAETDRLALNLSHGRLEGIVTDEGGRPVSGVAVSAQGSSLRFAVTNGLGRYRFDQLPPGAYILRAQRSGFSASNRDVVQVRPSGLTTYSFTLRRVAPPAVLAASLGADLGILQAETDPAAESGAEGPPVPEHDHSVTAWRLRHLKRSVLREAGRGPATAVASTGSDDEFDAGESFLGRAVGSPARLAAALFQEFPFTGQVRLLTTGIFDSPEDLFTGGSVPQGVTYFALEQPDAGWAVQAAMTQGDVSSWVVVGSSRVEPADSHQVDLTMSYATQRYDGGNPAALAAVSDGRRNVGALSAHDRWQITRQVDVVYGARYARYDYLDRRDLFSPSLAVAYAPARSTRLRAAASQQMLAPGAEEFVPLVVVGLWLPPERTFSTVSGAAFRPERTRHVEVGLEQDMRSFVLGVRRFQQQTDDQLVTAFGLPGEFDQAVDLGHYFVANGGAVGVQGWSVSVSRPVGSRVRGHVEYSVTMAEWAGDASGRQVALDGTRLERPAQERLHDVTTIVETDIPETATRVFATYRVNTGYAAVDEGVAQPGLGTRFDVQVHQRLPFLAFSSAQWEVLVAVRNVFRDARPGASVYDELLVLSPPKRIVGGLTVRF